MKKTAKETVLYCLMNENGLGLSEVNQKVKEQSEHIHTYHSIYKALQQLLKEGTVKKEGKAYFLSEQWIKEKLQLSSKVREHFNHLNGFTDTCPHLMEFTDIADLNKFLRKLEKDHLPIFDRERKGTIIWVVYHCYNYLLQPAKELSYIKKLKDYNIDFKILCYGDTLLDNWTKHAFEKFGAVMKTGSKVGGITGLNIYDDMVVEIYYGKEFLDALNEVYTNAPDTNALDLSELFERLSKIQYKISITIYRNKNIINCLKERALSFFK